jgi:SAM-dependent methyltransferase
MPADLPGQAILDYHLQLPAAKLWIHNKYGRKENMPVEHYFRDEADMPELELMALQACKGKVLDIGAAAGSHALALQNMQVEVTALDISPAAAQVMKARGVQQVLQADVYSLKEPQYDTLLLLMNGIGLAATVAGLHRFLDHAAGLLQPGGQLIFDSSDVAYLYKGKPPVNGPYYGEIDYQYEYQKQYSDWFTWLYIDQQTLAGIAATKGWQMEVLCEDEYDQYLVRMVRG